MRSKTIAGITIATSIGAAVLIPAVSAKAATCELEIGVTKKAGNYITGYGSLSQACGSNSSADITIQRYVALGYWQDEAATVVHGPGHDQVVNFYCVGMGTQTYHTRISATTVGGNYEQKDSNSIRVTC